MKLFQHYDEAKTLLGQAKHKFGKMDSLLSYTIDLKKQQKEEEDLDEMQFLKHSESIMNVQHQLLQAPIDRYQSFIQLQSYHQVFEWHLV